MDEKKWALLEKLTGTAGPSGDEAAVRGLLREQIEPYADELRVDGLGNLLAFKRGKRPAVKRLLFDAHMDEVGFIITGVREDGYLTFGALGGIDPRVALAKRVLVGPKRLQGVICGKPMPLLEIKDRGAPGKLEDLCIDIGADSREEAAALVRLGDTAVFDSAFVRFGEGLIKAKALDDRAGCLLLVALMQSELAYDAWFSFSVQEETGLTGAKTAAFGVAPDFAIVVESTTAADVGGVAVNKQVCRLGRGPAISFMDRSTLYPPALYRYAWALIEEKGLTAQVKEGVYGGNNAGAIHPSRAGVQTLTVSLPCRYIHSGASVIRESDFDAALPVLEALHERLAGGFYEA